MEYVGVELEDEPESLLLKERPKVEVKSVTLEEVRAVLAEKSRAGKTAEVKELLTKFGVNKLSELDSSKYSELLKETEGI